MEVAAVNSQSPQHSGQIPPNKPKRERVSEKKRERARDLEQELLFLQAHYRFAEEEDLCDLLQEAIVKAHRLGQATRQSDRDSVLHELELWEACETEEIMEATGLSRWVVDQILNEYEAKGLVTKAPSRDPVDGVGGRPRDVWSLIHTKP